MIRLIEDEDGDRLIDTGIVDRCCDGEQERFHIYDVKGFGGTNIYLNWSGHLTWSDLDKLKTAIKLAEEKFK